MPVISVVTRKGGAGKTTVSTALAGFLASGGVPAAIVDLDPQASASAWASARDGSRAAVQAVRSKPATLRDDVRRLLANGVSVVVVDTPPHSDACLAGAVDVADAVVMPSLPAAFDLLALSSAVEAVKAAGKPAGVILNAAVPNTRAIPDSVAAVEQMGVPLLGILMRRMVWQYAAAGGLAPSEMDPRCEAAKELNGICSSILALLEGR